MTHPDPRDIEHAARRALPDGAWDYFAGGADDERALEANIAAWARWRFCPHVLADVSTVTTSTEVLGTPSAAPLLIAPMAYQRLAHPDGEVAMAQAAAAAGVPMVAAAMATTALEDIAAAAEAAWFQIYVDTDRGFTAELAARAAAAGYRALVLTADLAVRGDRRRDAANAFVLPGHLAIANVPSGESGRRRGAYSADLDAAVTPETIGWLAEVSGLPVVLKGVLRGDDAAAAVAAGAAGIAVSNHGGRQLGDARATARALPEVLDALGDAAEIYVDGGVRSGADVVKALALGARAVLVGRACLWGLAAGGRQGVSDVLAGLFAGIARTMALCGTPSVSAVAAAGRGLLEPVDACTCAITADHPIA